MYQVEEIKKITKKMIEYFDYPISILTKESGLSRPTVSKFFNHKLIRPSSQEKLVDLCIELLKNKVTNKQKLKSLNEEVFTST